MRLVVHRPQPPRLEIYVLSKHNFQTQPVKSIPHASENVSYLVSAKGFKVNALEPDLHESKE